MYILGGDVVFRVSLSVFFSFQFVHSAVMILKQLNVVPQLSSVHIGTLFERHAMSVLSKHLSMALWSCWQYGIEARNGIESET